LTNATCDPTGLRIPGPERTGEAVEYSSFDFMHDGAGQVIVAQTLAISSEAICEHRGYPLPINVLPST
jgi:hypothetical protein